MIGVTVSVIHCHGSRSKSPLVDGVWGHSVAVGHWSSIGVGRHRSSVGTWDRVGGWGNVAGVGKWSRHSVVGPGGVRGNNSWGDSTNHCRRTVAGDGRISWASGHGGDGEGEDKLLDRKKNCCYCFDP